MKSNHKPTEPIVQDLTKNTQSGMTSQNQKTGQWLSFRMAAIFSHKWTSRIEGPTVRELVENEWSLGLQGLTAEQIQHGVDRARVECDWPPSISEFINLALDIPTLAQFLAGDKEMEDIVYRYNHAVDRFLANRMDSSELVRWKRDIYPFAVETMRAVKTGKVVQKPESKRPEAFPGV